MHYQFSCCPRLARKYEVEHWWRSTKTINCSADSFQINHVTSMSWHLSLRMIMWYWSVAILFWQLWIDDIVNVQYKRCEFAKTRLRHPSLPFDSLPYPTRTIFRRVHTCVGTIGQSRDNQTKRGWPYSMSRGPGSPAKIHLEISKHSIPYRIK